MENERTATICFVCLNYDVVCLCHAQNRQFIDGKLEQNEANLQKLFKKYLLNRLVQKYSLLLTSIILLTVAAVRLCYLYN